MVADDFPRPKACTDAVIAPNVAAIQRKTMITKTIAQYAVIPSLFIPGTAPTPWSTIIFADVPSFFL